MEKQVIQPEQVTEYLTEIKEKCRLVTLNDEVFVVKFPNEGLMNEGRIIYTKSLTQCIKEGIPTKAEMRKTLVQAITASGKDPAILDKRQALLQKLADGLKDVVPQEEVPKTVTNLPDFMAVVEKAFTKFSMEERELLHQVADLEELEIGMMSNCAEAIAATHRDLYILSRCVFTSNNERKWPDFQSIMDEQDLTLISEMSDEFQRYLSGLPMLFEVVLPEPKDLPEGFPTPPLS